MVVRAAASLAGGYMAVSLKDRPVDRGQQDSRLQRYATIVAQLSAQRMHTSAQCFIWASSPMRSHDCAHLRQTSAQVPQNTGDTFAPVSMASALVTQLPAQAARRAMCPGAGFWTPWDRQEDIVSRY